MGTFLEDTTDLLRRTPEVLRALLRDLPESWTDTADVPENGWRPKDVVGHLITGELTDWIERTQRILEHGTSVPFDRFDRFAHADRDSDATLDELVEHFARLRPRTSPGSPSSARRKTSTAADSIRRSGR
jgi:hypothetical protein